MQTVTMKLSFQWPVYVKQHSAKTVQNHIKLNELSTALPEKLDKA